ncbi:hypothetical protein [Streptomyces sp. ADI98-10]|uniref:hypothetical protein n=1 Tax=Streptomyces sp. ADI98-10 TaxID=1522763 RepID=UPI000F5535CB|nr:hypothetical protein [Streptomyces sp. ADI98-10]RPK91405.1 hypothetical protein EES46_10685 [Streptomyces sp. ADI98-10]
MTSRSRPPRLRPLLLTVTLALALAAAGCGTEPAPDRVAGRSSSGDPAPDRAELEARASAAQIVAEHVWVTEAAGYALARQSVGVLGDDGFGSSYTAPDGGMLQLSVERRPHAEADCTDGSAAAGGSEPLWTCERDGEQWYRATESGHAYAREQGELVITVSGAREKVDRATLRSAARAAHRADDHELDQVLPPAGDASGRQPVERGDLPPMGDGAPNNDVGASG